jgi:hypothetical protein
MVMNFDGITFNFMFKCFSSHVAGSFSVPANCYRVDESELSFPKGSTTAGHVIAGGPSHFVRVLSAAREGHSAESVLRYSLFSGIIVRQHWRTSVNRWSGGPFLGSSEADSNRDIPHGGRRPWVGRSTETAEIHR